MKKNGYTLAEVLITLCTIGIIEALCAPLINKYKPDANKIMYLKTYDMIVNTVGNLASNDKIYSPICEEKYDCTKVPLFNTDDVELYDGNKILGGQNKLARALAYMVGAEVLDDNNDSYITKENINFSKPTFIAKNGTSFIVTSKRNLSEVSESSYQTDIYFDVNGENAPNCMGVACKSADRFHLAVGADARVYAMDGVGANYIASRSNWRLRFTEGLTEPNVLISNFDLPKLPDYITPYTPQEVPNNEDPTPQYNEDITAFNWGNCELYYVPQDSWYGNNKECYDVIFNKIKSFLDDKKREMLVQNYHPEMVEAAYKALLSYYENLIYKHMVSPGHKSNEYQYEMVTYTDVNGKEVTTGAQYWAGCWYKPETALSNLKTYAEKRNMPTGIYFVRKYKGTSRIKMAVDLAKVAKKYTDFYKAIEQ